MCIIAWITHPNDDFKLILIANRDEAYSRPTANSHFWTDKNIIASQDLLYYGTQLAIDLHGRMAALTNLASEKNDNPNTLTRGLLTVNFFDHNDMKSYAESIQDTKYMPYNLLLGDFNENKYTMSYSKYNGEKNTLLDTGKVYVLENKGLFDYVERAEVTKEMFAKIVNNCVGKEDLIQELFGLLHNENVFRFYPNINYGTRTQTIVLIDKDNRMTFIERLLYLMGSVIETNGPAPANIVRQCHIINNGNSKWIENKYEYIITKN